jgi:hypothetical protein
MEPRLVRGASVATERRVSTSTLNNVETPATARLVNVNANVIASGGLRC